MLTVRRNATKCTELPLLLHGSLRGDFFLRHIGKLNEIHAPDRA